MSIWQAIVLGFVQGATEYAPVSSSGHLILVPWLFGWQQLGGDAGFAKTFDVALHMGTLLGAVIYFRARLWRYLRAWFAHDRGPGAIETTDERIAWALVRRHDPGRRSWARSLESVIQDSLGAPWLIAVMLAVFGVVLYEVDTRMPSVARASTRSASRTGLVPGLAQAMALQPGVSRSGVTMTAARAIGLDRETAARFSFLLSLPIIAGAGLYKGVDARADRVPGVRGAVLLGLRLVGGERVPRDLGAAEVPEAARLQGVHALPARGGGARARA